MDINIYISLFLLPDHKLQRLDTMHQIYYQIPAEKFQISKSVFSNIILNMDFTSGSLVN
jgi:hypothetical protein